MSYNRILVSAYACEPNLGSEIGVGWHWVLEMSRYFELWVLTRRSNKSTIERWLHDNCEKEDFIRDGKGEGLISNIHFVYFDLPRWARFWKKGLRGVRTYYNLWQIFTNRLVRKEMKRHDIHLFHHLTYGNVMWPVSGYGSRQTFVWGPVGGLETIPYDFSRHYDKKQQLVESMRRLFVWKTIHSIGFRRRCRRADIILCKTEITRSKLPEKYRYKAVLFTDVAPDSSLAKIKPIEPRCSTSSLSFICVGRLEAWRGFDIAIEALALAADKSMHLTIVGNGPDRRRLEALVAKLRINDQVTFTGKVGRDEYLRLMSTADVVINPALKEGAVTVAFDAMALGKPLIAIETSGYTRYFNSQNAIVVPLSSRDSVIASLAEGFSKLKDSEARHSLGRGALESSKSYSWRTHGREIRDAISALNHMENGR